MVVVLADQEAVTLVEVSAAEAVVLAVVELQEAGNETEGKGRKVF
jgi:hypothetical protein